MKTYITPKVIALLLVAIAVIFSAFYFSSFNLNKLTSTVAEATKPDLFLIRLDEMNAGLINAESGVRAFAISHDDYYLNAFNQLKKKFNPDFDSLYNLASDDFRIRIKLDFLKDLVRQKFNLYNEMMLVSYSEIFDSALVQLTSEIPPIDSLPADTLPVEEKKQNFLQKVFGSGPSRKELQAKIDSAMVVNKQSNEKIKGIKQHIGKVSEFQSQKLKEQTRKELAILNRDNGITMDINNLILEIKSIHVSQFGKKAEDAKNSAQANIQTIRYIIITGLIFIVILIGLILYDVFKSSQYRKELAKAKAQAEKFAKIKEEFLAGMSHEIRTPLTSILGYAGRLSKTVMNDQQSFYAKSIQVSSEHLLSIVNDILDLTRIDTGNLKFEKTNFNPAEVIREVCDVLRIKAAEKNIQLIIEISRIKNLMVNGDPLRLRQVLFNIIGNAIKFTEEGEVKIKALTVVDESTEADNYNAIIKFKVEDTGIGIPKAKLKNLFNQYVQADESISRKFGGSGLGLSISKKIIEQQGGTISVESKPEEGTVFTFEIPYEKSKAEIQDTDILKPDRVSGYRFSRPVKILLAEDVDINRDLQYEMLKDTGAEVTAVSNGREILEKLGNHYDVVLLDIQMPVMNGIETVKVIRKQFGKSIPVIAMTANVMENDVQRYLEAGFDEVLFKPFREEEIVRIISARTGIEYQRIESADEKPKSFVAERLYDLDELIRTSHGNNDFVSRMIKVFISSADALLIKAKTNIADRNYDTLSANVHRLIPSCRQLSISIMAEKLKRIEYICNTSKDVIEIENLFNEIQNNFAQIKTLFEEEVKKFEKTKPVL